MEEPHVASPKTARCRICDEATSPSFDALVLGRHRVGYHTCGSCGFLQTDEPFWLKEAYAAPIASVDVGLLSRNAANADATSLLIDRLLPQAERFLDHGGGYGIFTRMMRDRGYAFLHHDPHCENLFAPQHGCQPQAFDRAFDLTTAWEVFEHLVDPVATAREVLGFSRVLLFSTVLQPAAEIRSAEDWWYLVPETGQHVGFYTVDALHRLAERCGACLRSDGTNLHTLSREPLPRDPFASAPPTPRGPGRRSLLDADFADAMTRLRLRQAEPIGAATKPRQITRPSREAPSAKRLPGAGRSAPA
ncbi:hypothetical protein PSMK_25230 [Phycisphaera mikurensis NBRC 102666]|uniref:Methyltransferase n=1 Tax=Phycisphaera mikurensis (strain NBRC 102666 / KCTC 22515 / FYK2301M01) TaxID=1142394 RepID=I0IHE4_PHYMF|nr:hypothetical protein PSMK_25230 [Phycisphaera mikurensis NBRC 102666]